MVWSLHMAINVLQNFLNSYRHLTTRAWGRYMQCLVLLYIKLTTGGKFVAVIFFSFKIDNGLTNKYNNRFFIRIFICLCIFLINFQYRLSIIILFLRITVNYLSDDQIWSMNHLDCSWLLQHSLFYWLLFSLRKHCYKSYHILFLSFEAL